MAIAVPVAGAAAATVTLTRVAQNAVATPMAGAQETKELAVKANQKKWENMQKGFSEDLFNEMALKYFEAEEFKKDSKAERKAQDFAMLYAAINASQKEEVDKMSDEEVQRENHYEDPIETETTADGTVKLAGDSERKLISDSIVETAQKCGIMDLGDFALTDSRVAQIKTTIATKLRTSGAAGNFDKNAEVIIEQLDNKIKEEQKKLAKTGTKTSEEKMTDDAIIAVMQEKGITDPSKVKDEDVQAKYEEIYTERIAGAKTSDSSQDVIGKMNNGKLDAQGGVKQNDGSASFREGTSGVVKPSQTAGSKEVTGDGTSEVTDLQNAASGVHTSKEAGKTISAQSITARKSIMSTKAQKGLSQNASQAMRDTLKKKREAQLDTLVLTLDEVAGAGTASDVSANEKGGVSTSDGTPKLPGFAEFVGTVGKDAGTIIAEQTDAVTQKDQNKTDKVLEMLNAQTEFNRAKKELELVPNRTATSNQQKRSMYIDSLMNGSLETNAYPSSRDGSRRANKNVDGSRRVNGQTSTVGKDLHSQDMAQMLETIKKNTSKKISNQ